MKAIAMFALVALWTLAACGDASGRAARTKYNAGVALLGEGKLDEAEQSLLAARDLAGYDDEVRFRAAFDLAAVAVARAEAAQAAQPPAADQAMAAYEKARTWLSDAVRRRPKDADARANLERVEARLLALIDEAGQGDNALEKRLDRAIAAERDLRDAARALWAGQAASGGDPLAAKDQFEAAATRQRTLGAEVGTIADLAGDEITAIGGKAEEERSDEEKVRLVQLQNLDLYVQDARKAMTDARRNLHELAGELAHQRTGAALESLKRAREQLIDPLAVLQGVAADELELARYLAALQAHAGKDDPLPAWLTARGLGGDQIDVRARLEEVKARLQAALDAPAPGADGGTPDPKAAEAAKLKAQVAAAMPSLEEASRQMKVASDALAAEDVAAGSTAAQASLVAIATAIEQFFALRQLIDVTLAQERDVIAAITPPAEGAQALPAAERAKRVNDGVGKNRARLERMKALIAEEQDQATAPPPADPSGAAPAAPDPQKLEEQKQLFARAEALRAEADAALVALAAVAAGGKGPPALDSAKLAEAKLVELQKLFFSVIEHLKELIREQGETRDDTTTAQTEDDAGRAARLPGLIERQSTHGQMAEDIAQALASQADAAAQQGGPGGAGGAPPGGPSPQALGQAAQEVRSALGSMQDATTTLTQARDQAQQMSYDIGPAIESQKTAVEHLENALRLLQPPQDKQDKQDQQNQQQQQPQPDQQDQQDQQQQSADQQLQQVREREAQREREKRERERQAGGADPVDKDW